MTNAATYTVYQITNNWNRRGDAVNVQETVIGQTSDPVVAYALRESVSKYGEVISSWGQVRDTNGARVRCFDLYVAVVGADVVAAQEADPAFSINLDLFFQGLAAQ